MNLWWEDKELIETQKTCDQAFYSKDSDLLDKMSIRCFNQGHIETLHPMIKASYLYCCATCLLNIVAIKNLEPNEKEEIYERCLYLFRTAKDLCQSIDEEESNHTVISKGYLNGFNYQLIVNYSNLLSQCGRYVKSINTLNEIIKTNYPMALGNSALKIVDYSYFAENHKHIMQHHAYKVLQNIKESDFSFPERAETEKSFLSYSKWIEKSLGIDFLQNNFSITDFFNPIENMHEDEKNYRKWMSVNRLSLNQLNDVFIEEIVGYDPLHLPSMVVDIHSRKNPIYHGIFNQIKQEYVSARFWIYEGLTDRTLHYSDKEVYLVNTLDYPVYGLGIEKIKAAYRSIYSIFDKIAYFLNKYLELKIPDRFISFQNLWFQKVEKQQIRRDSVLKIQHENFALEGLWWIYKDFRNKTVYKDKHIDPVLKKISKVRNAMEHKHLKILDYFDDNSKEHTDSIDTFAYNIGFKDFEELTIALLQLTREAILQLTMIIQIEEDKKESKRNPGEKILPMALSTYDDDWKQIW